MKIFAPRSLSGAEDPRRTVHFVDAMTLRVALAVFGLSLFFAGLLIGGGCFG
jgi:hypothetical protein